MLSRNTRNTPAITGFSLVLSRNILETMLRLSKRETLAIASVLRVLRLSIPPLAPGGVGTRVFEPLGVSS